MRKKILITTGGSGGHVLPALTIFDHLKNEYDLLISTDRRGLKYFESENYKPIIIDTPKIKISIFFPFIIFKVFLLIIKSLSILKKEKISILISTGGYMSLPFLSYGGSSIISTSVLAGIILNLTKRKIN